MTQPAERGSITSVFSFRLPAAVPSSNSTKSLWMRNITLGVTYETNLIKALEWCDVANMLRVQNERLDVSYFPNTREYTQQFGLTNEILNNLNKEIVVMHPGPINRGVEITSDVADGNHSVILDQVENGVAVRMAVIYLLASKIQN